MRIFCGIDWAEGHHDIALVDEAGGLVAKQRIPESVAGFTVLTEMLQAAGDTAEAPVPVAIETPRGCWSQHCGPPAATSMRSTRWR